LEYSCKEITNEGLIKLADNLKTLHSLCHLRLSFEEFGILSNDFIDSSIDALKSPRLEWMLLWKMLENLNILKVLRVMETLFAATE